MNQNPDALECDMAETYGVFDIYSLPLRKLATLACGLRENARINMELSGTKIDIQTMLLALLADKTAEMCWLNSVEGAQGVNHPPSIYRAIMDPTKEEKEQESEVMTFRTPEEYEEYMRNNFGEG